MERQRPSFLNRLSTAFRLVADVQAEDDDVQRRGRLLGILILTALIALSLLTLLNLVQLLVSPSAKIISYVVSDFIVTLLLVGLLYLARSGHIRWAGYGFLFLSIIAASSSFRIATLDRALLVYAVPTMTASFLVSPGSSFVFALLSTAGYTLAYLAGSPSHSYNYVSMMGLFIMAVVAWLAATSGSVVMGFAIMLTEGYTPGQMIIC